MLLDASALMAYLTGEPGTEEVLQVVSTRPCRVSSIALTEVEGKLVGRGELTHGQVLTQFRSLLSLVREVPFDQPCREHAAFYYARKSPYNLSLADAACLGTAGALGTGVLTAERGWAKIPDLPFTVQLIR